LGARGTGLYSALSASQQNAARASPKGLPALTALGQAYVSFAHAHPTRLQFLGHPLVVEQYGYDADLVHARQTTYTLLLGAVNDAMADGSIRAGDPAATAIYAWSTVHGFALLRAAEALSPLQGAPTDQWEERLLGAMYFGFRPDT